MMDSMSLARLTQVHPTLDAKVCKIVFEFEEAHPGDTLVVAQGMRRWADQERLWLQGRDGTGKVVNPGKVVTNAQPGYSWHEFGLAVDLVPKSLLAAPDWGPTSPLWPEVTALAEKHGLVCGSCWMHKDLPHVQLTGIFPVTPTDEVRKLYLQGTVKAVWAAANIPAE